MKTIRRWMQLCAFFGFQFGFVWPMMRWYWGVRFRRRHNVPQGPCIVVANHNSHLDAGVLMQIFPARRMPHVHPVAAADYFGQTAWRRMLSAAWMNAMPIERTAAPGKDVLQPMIDALRAGETLIFFPEGSRGEPGVVAAFRPGIGKIVKSLPGVLVLPVFLSGTERSMPRGESVPLPLGIDVNIGKPRTYSALLDARDIAEEVRNAVLALAPPPLPVPGPRPQPPVRIACCGIDGDTNRALVLALTERLGASGTTIGFGETMLESDAGGVREATRVPRAGSGAWPRLLAWAFRTGSLYRGNKFSEMVLRVRVDEALQDGRTARFVVSDGSPLVDLLAWAQADFYRGVFDEKGVQQILLYLTGQRRIPLRDWLDYARKAPEVWLLNAFDLAHPQAPDVLVLTTLGPEAAMERIRSRGKALEPHQNDAFLAKLQEAYIEVASVLRRRRVEVVELSAEDLRLGDAVDHIDAACRRVALKGVETPAGG